MKVTGLKREFDKKKKKKKKRSLPESQTVHGLSKSGKWLALWFFFSITGLVIVEHCCNLCHYNYFSFRFFCSTPEISRCPLCKIEIRKEDVSDCDDSLCQWRAHAQSWNPLNIKLLLVNRVQPRLFSNSYITWWLWKQAQFDGLLAWLIAFW